MQYQLWYSESERSGVLLHDEDRTSPKQRDARVIWTVEANTYDEALQKRDEFLERAGFAFASCERTTRVTMCAYLDSNGNEQVFEMAGWIDDPTQTQVRLAQARSGCLASRFIFVERPYGDLASAPEVFTAVDI